jgi:serine-type D-Ala-D-Ala carboxypeptidase/endopeptidase (penicillin-binding protein 4)
VFFFNNADIMRTCKEWILILTVYLLLSAHPAAAYMAERIKDVITQPIKQKVQFSIHVVNPKDGNTVFDYDAKKRLVPASNMKAVTTAAALHYLGADFKYKTIVGLRGKTLVIIGSGDPLLGDPVTDDRYKREKNWIFKQIAQALRQAGVTSIENIVIDSGVFEDRPTHPNWPAAELNRWYACEVSGLNFNANCVNIIAKNVDGKIELRIEPPTNYLTLTNEVDSISSGSSAIAVYRGRQPNKLRVTGKCKDQATLAEIAIERPAAMFGYMLYEYLTGEKISVSGQLTETVLSDYKNIKELTVFETPLSDCLARANKDSLGLVAECLMKTIAAAEEPNHKNGSWEKGGELVGQYLENLDIDDEQFNIDDGSGLSEQNGLSAFAITTVILDVYNSDNWKMYRDSLSVGGVDGTLDKYFKESKYKGKVLGKTGYINGIRSLSGVCITPQGEIIYSILANNASSISRDTLNKIAEAVMDEYTVDDTP